MNKNNTTNFDNENRLEGENQLIKKTQTILQKYGYSLNSMKYDVAIGKDYRRADLVVFDENNSPLIIVEIKKDEFILPLSEYHLKELLVNSKANFGLLYNGTEKHVYQRIETSMIQISDIPKKNCEKNFITTKNTEEFQPFLLSEKVIWNIAEKVRRDFYDFTPLLQVLAIKILDEEKFEGKLFKKYQTKHFDKDDVIQLIQIGVKHFPIIFKSFFSDIYIKEPHINIFIELFNIIKNFSIQRSDVDNITKAILRFSWGRNTNYFTGYPEELVYFTLKLLSLEKNKKIFNAFGEYGYNFDISNFFKKNFNLTRRSLTKYVENYLTINSINSDRNEVLQLISLLRKEPIKIVKENFLKLDQKFIDSFDYIVCTLPFGATIYSNEEVKNILGDHGKKLINYVFLKLLKSQKSKLKIAVLVESAFLFSRNFDKVRLSILESGFLKGIIELPTRLMMPLTGISMALIIIDFSKPVTKNQHHIFLSQIPEIKPPSQKLDLKALDQTLENFKKFESNEEFTYTSLSFVLNQNNLTKSWTVSDKTPEMQNIMKIQYGVKLGSLGKIFYGKSEIVNRESESHQKIPYLRISDIQDGLIKNPVQKLITIKDYKKYSDILINENDVVFSCQGTIGKVALAGKRDVGILPSPQIIVIRPNKKKILPEYLIQALTTEKVRYQIERKSQGTFIPRLNIEDLQNIVIANPPLSRQQKLVAKFRKRKVEIENLETELAEAKKNLLKLNST